MQGIIFADYKNCYPKNCVTNGALLWALRLKFVPAELEIDTTPPSPHSKGQVSVPEGFLKLPI